MKLHRKYDRRSEQSAKERIMMAVQYFPLLSAVFAPLSTLLDIPGLTEPWFTLYGVRQPDIHNSIILSGFSLAFNVLANALLVARFTVKAKRWNAVMTASVVCWITKLTFAAVNLIYYGAYIRNDPGYEYAGGFWAAVLSLVLSTMITSTLIIHWLYRKTLRERAGVDDYIRIAGANFMFAVMAFIVVLAIQALIFSRIEKWRYADAIYFSVVTSLTIGYGDFAPTKVSTQILDFPFAVLSIALLAVMIGQIVNFFAERAAHRKESYRARFEKEFEKRRNESGDLASRTLVMEIAELQAMEAMEEKYNFMFDLLVSIFSLVVFWLIGAAMFSAIEGWSFGTGLFFVYVSILTLGYGDPAPTTPAGRVVFIVYALCAVPVMTSFILQTVTGLFSTVANRMADKAKDRRLPSDAELKFFHSHAYIVDKRLELLERQRIKDQEELTRVVMHLAVRLEAQARTLLIEKLEPKGKAAIILRADRSLQHRTVESLRKDEERMEDDPLYKAALDLASDLETERHRVFKSDDLSKSEVAAPEEVRGDELQQVRAYRQTYAALLAAGSRLMKLEGDERWMFEKRLELDHTRDLGGVVLGSKRKGPAEKKMDVDV